MAVARAPQQLGLGFAVPDHWRPVTRADCARVERPCPYVGCRHHNYLEVTETGAIRLNFPDIEPDEMDEKESCSLDKADVGPSTLLESGAAVNVSPERARQHEEDALDKLEGEVPASLLEAWGIKPGGERGSAATTTAARWRQIVAAIAHLDGPTNRELTEVLGFDPSDRNGLKYLVRARLVVRIGPKMRARYWLPEQLEPHVEIVVNGDGVGVLAALAIGTWLRGIVALVVTDEGE